jgi:PQQ enzyme repeat
VYVGAHSGKFSCIDVDSGEELWTQQLPDRIEATASITKSGSFIYVGKKLDNFFKAIAAIIINFRLLRRTALLSEPPARLNFVALPNWCYDQELGGDL